LAPKIKAVLIPALGRFVEWRRLSELIFRIENVVFNVFVYAAVKLVGAAFRDDVKNREAIPMLGAKVRRDQADFFYRFRRRGNVIGIG
jgi:hypothetical protein